MDPRRPNLTLRDFFLHEQRMVAEAQINSFFRRLIYTLIVLNVLLGSITYYDRYIHESNSKILRDVSKILINEV